MAGIQNSFTDQEFIDEGLDFFATHEDGIRRRIQEGHESFFFMTARFNVPDLFITADQGVTEVVQAYRPRKHDKGNIFFTPFETRMRDQKVNYSKDILKGFRSYVNNFRNVAELASATPYAGEVINGLADAIPRDAENQSAFGIYKDPSGLADDVVPETINGTNGYMTLIKELVKTGKLVPVNINNSFTPAGTYDFHFESWRKIPKKYRDLPMNVMEGKDIGIDYWKSYVDQYGENIAERRLEETRQQLGPNLNVTGTNTVPAEPPIELSSCVPRPVFGMKNSKTLVYVALNNLLKLFGPQDSMSMDIDRFEPHVITFSTILQYVFTFNNLELLFVSGEIIEAPAEGRLVAVADVTADINLPEVGSADEYRLEVATDEEFTNIVFDSNFVAANVAVNVYDKALPDGTLEKTAIYEQATIQATGLTAETTYYARGTTRMGVTGGKLDGIVITSSPGEKEDILQFKTTA